MSKTKSQRYTPFEIRSLRRLAEARDQNGTGHVDRLDWPGKPQQLGAALTCLQKKELLTASRVPNLTTGGKRTYFTLTPTALSILG
jgi:DNA-binding PadR family transcriptional regulator